MTTRQYSRKRIIVKLREMDKYLGQELPVAQACKELGVSDMTFYRWRHEGGRGAPP